jgi:hypothetical protein
VRVWVEDVRYDLAMALRAVGVGIVAVAWASALGSEAQQSSDIRSYAEVAAIVVSVLIVQLLTWLPPSATVRDLLKPMERDIVAVARERAYGDAELLQLYIARITAMATVRIRQGANVPRDRRAWLRGLLRLAELDET